MCLFWCCPIKPDVVCFLYPIPQSKCIAVHLFTKQHTTRSVPVFLKKILPLSRCCKPWDTCWQRMGPHWQAKAPLLSCVLNTPRPNLKLIRSDKSRPQNSPTRESHFLLKVEGRSQMSSQSLAASVRPLHTHTHTHTLDRGNNRSWRQKEQLLSKVRLQIKKTF